jgi:hypothetical protein
MKRYYAKLDTWFKEGTEAFREEEMFPHGSLTDGETGEKTGSAIYRGIYVIGSGGSYLDESYKEGEEVEMREHCSDDEFLVVEE